MLGSCSLGSGLRSRSLALNKDNAWWGSSVSTAGAGPYRKALAREQEIKGVPAIEGMPAEVVPADSGPFPSARVGSRPAVGNLAIEGCRTGRGPFSCLARARPSPAAFHNVHTAPFRSASLRRWGIVGAPNSLVSGPGQAHNVFLPLGNQDSLGDGSRRARDRSRRTEPRSRRREKKRALERSGPFSFWFYNAETANNSPPPLIDRRCRSAKGLGPCVPTQEQGNRVSAADCGNPNHRAADLDP